jgi:F-type H+-transporting ATPase subunit gamma
MAKARAIVKRRKAVRNIRKITKTMQMIATAKFQKALKRAVGTKPFTLKVRELVSELADSLGGEVDHPLLRKVDDRNRKNRIAVLVITANRGLAGAYNGNVLRASNAFIKQQEAAGKTVDLYAVGKKGITFFNYQKRPIKARFETNMDNPKFAEVERGAQDFMQQFIDGQIDAVYVASMNFISTGVQKPAGSAKGRRPQGPLRARQRQRQPSVRTWLRPENWSPRPSTIFPPARWSFWMSCFR